MPIIVLAGLMLVLPFLNYLRFIPNPDWITDAATIGLVALALVYCSFINIVKKKSLQILDQGVVKLPAAVIFGILWLVYIQLSPYFLNRSLYPLQSMGVIFGLAIGLLVYQVAQKKSKQYVLNILSAFILFGVLLQCIIGFAQAVGLAPEAYGYMMYSPAFPKSSIMGNIAQRNQFAHYLGWGLVTCCYLYCNRKLSVLLALPCIGIISLLMAWSSSRLVLAYGFGFAVFTLFWKFRNGQDEQLHRFARAAMWAVLAIAITQLFSGQITHFLQWLGLPLDDLGSGAGRVTESGLGARRRLEWSKAWQAFRLHPWFGTGLGGYPLQSVWLETVGGHEPMVERGLFTHSHNLVMQLLAETGVVGTLLAGSGIFWCATSFFRRGQQNSEYLLLASCLMITLVHSMFEYPLWYLPFFSGFIIFLSLAPVRPLRLSLRPALRSSLAALLGLTGLLYVSLGYSNYFNVVEWSKPTKLPAVLASRDVAARQLALNPFWTYEADTILAMCMPVSRAALTPDNVELLERLVAYRPYPVPLIRLAIMRAYAGRQAEAEDLILMAFAGHPLDTLSNYEGLMTLKDPALKPLQALAKQANTAYTNGGPEAVVRWATAIERRRGRHSTDAPPV